MPTEADLLRQAMVAHGAGRLDEARALYEEVISLNPGHANALYGLGVIAHQTGNQALAVGLIRQALSVQPDQHACYNVLGLALMNLEEYDEAEDSFQRAIALQPAAGYYNNLGHLRRKQDRLDEAIAAYRRAAEHDPQFASAHFNLGIVLRAKGELAEAAECFRRAENIEPANGRTVAALGQTLAAMECVEEALPFLERAASLLPDDADLRSELADALQSLGRFDKAAREYQQSLDVDPHRPQVWYAAGCAETSRGEYVAAVACFCKALDLDPNWAEAQHNLGKALFQLGQVDEAANQFRQAAASDRPELPRAMLAVIIPGSSVANNRTILDARRAWARHYPPVPGGGNSGRGAEAPRSRLRIGYVSSFFHRHNWMKPVWGLIGQHDREKFEVHLFSDAPASAIQSSYALRAEDHVHDITGLPNAAAAERIQQSDIDLLVDLNGYSKVERLGLFTLRPAPRIAGWFNMYATTGMPCYDFLIGDDTVIPPGEEKFYCEQIIRVPGSYLTFEVAYAVPDVAPPPCASGRPLAFGCLAPLYKITKEVIAAWSKILQQAGGSSLLLKNTAFASPASRQYVRALFERHNIAAERIRLEGPSDHEKFLRTYDEVDVALDTFPYNGGTTTTEAIWQGVPVVAIWGDRWVARTSASILRAANLSRFVCRDVDEYVSMVIQMAASPDTPAQLSEYRRNMRSQLRASPVCDTQGFARNMERIYCRMCER